MTSAPEFNVVFKGEIAAGYDPLTARLTLAKVLNVSAEQLEACLSGNAAIVKRNLYAAAARNLQQELRAAGAIIELQPVSTAEASGNSLTAKTLELAPRATPPKQPIIDYASLSVEPIIESAFYKKRERETHDDSEIHESFARKILGFNYLAAILSLGVWYAFLLVAIGAIAMLIFSPYPDLVVRKGFVLGAVVLLYGLRKLYVASAASQYS